MRDKVWFTYKARIQAQIRLSRLEFHSQLLLVWYAILSAALAVVTVRYPQALGKDTDVLSAVLSIALLGISLAAANRDFRGRSIAMRQNYLALQHLYDRTAPPNSFAHAELLDYHNLLAAVENHSEMDDRVFRTLHAAGLTTRVPTSSDKVRVWSYLVLRLVVLAMLYSAPLAVALLK